MSYKNLEVWRIARELAVDIHQTTLGKLPKSENFEEGGQIRPSIKSVKSTITEDYGRRRYKNDFIRYLVYAAASCDETRDHLETLLETGSLTDLALYENLRTRLDVLGEKLFRLIQSVETGHRSDK
jgi:four helix bundle protein